MIKGISPSVWYDVWSKVLIYRVTFRLSWRGDSDRISEERGCQAGWYPCGGWIVQVDKLRLLLCSLPPLYTTTGLPFMATLCCLSHVILTIICFMPISLIWGSYAFPICLSGCLRLYAKSILRFVAVRKHAGPCFWEVLPFVLFIILMLLCFWWHVHPGLISYPHMLWVALEYSVA